MRSDLGNLLKALGRLEEAKVRYSGLAPIYLCSCFVLGFFFYHFFLFKVSNKAKYRCSLCFKILNY